MGKTNPAGIFVPNDTPEFGDTWIWQSAGGPRVRLTGVFVYPHDATGENNPAITVKRTASAPGVLDYALQLSRGDEKIEGTIRLEARPDPDNADAILCRSAISFDQPVRDNLCVEWIFDVLEPGLAGVWLPERNGQILFQPSADYGSIGGRYELGDGAAYPAGINLARGPGVWPRPMVRRALISRTGTTLGMPVIGLRWKKKDATPTLSVAADPYCGATLAASALFDADTPCTRVAILTGYQGSLAPIREERRTISLEYHADDPDLVFRSFYKTIPEIHTAPEWIESIHLVYYDYLSELGQGWFKDIETLAKRIPEKYRRHVALCLHGWYDYFQQYAFDEAAGKLLPAWTAFPGTYKVPMSIADMHRRMQFAREKGFRVLLYFADGTNSDSGSPHFRPEYLLKDKTGQRFKGWKGPDSLGQPYKMDPSIPGLRNWYRSYLRALLEEYAQDIDGLVWDETFYVPSGFVSYGGGQPAYADRAMMSLVSEFTQLVQSYRNRNPNLVFLASDCGWGSNGLVANGTYEDAACTAGSWGASMFANYRNCLWSCNWVPVSQPQNNRIAATDFGMPQGLSNGWEDSRGPNNMPPELLDEILKRFFANCDSKRERQRTLRPAE